MMSPREFFVDRANGRRRHFGRARVDVPKQGDNNIRNGGDYADMLWKSHPQPPQPHGLDDTI
jgi:hypothetical protein